MKRFLRTLFFLLLGITAAHATTIKGRVYDSKTGETLIGATIQLEKTGLVTSTGLDGSFELKHAPTGNFVLRVSYLRYKTVLMQLEIQKEDNDKLKIYLEEQNGKDLSEVVIQARHDGSAEKTARRLEQQSVPLVNMVSGRAMEVSPDLTVANVIQRVSGVSIERNSNGDGQYAILRGMDKRYNYTLVNGVKIPSPDNKYRYVPLDIFPSELLERLEVYKTLTPNMEGDAIGGVVNMVMKDAPAKLQVNANLATGYSQLFMDRKFMSFNASDIQHKSPYERNGKAYQATQNDFAKGTLDYKSKSPAPNLVGGLSIGQRFLDNKLGVIVAGSYQNTYRGSNSTFYSSALVGTDKFATVNSVSDRQYSEQQKRYGLHAKVDYVFGVNNKLSWYNAYVDLSNYQTRDAKSVSFSSDYDPIKGNAQLSYSTRTRFTEQQIYNSTLHGDHTLFDGKFNIQWSAVYSAAKNEVPDNTTISFSGARVNFMDNKTVINNSTRRWDRNTDEDKAGYLDLTYKAELADFKIDFIAGGLYRDKQRSGFFNNYNFLPVDVNALYGYLPANYADVRFSIQNPGGAVNNPLTYDASEKTAAVYGMFKFNLEDLYVVGGVRMEHTDQGYNLLFPAAELRPAGSQIYSDYLPSLNLKYLLTKRQQLRASYFRSVNRPGFYELIPSKVINEEYLERGNPDLKRAIADNYDLRYEWFPNQSDQLLVGAFYKKIQDPIEYTFQADAIRGQDVFYMPGNFGTARNYGLEVDYIKFIKKFGVKANYTYTHSRITTDKFSRFRDPVTDQLLPMNVKQTRPLYGQSAHIANLSLIYKDTKHGWDGQLSGSYTGERINTVSQFVDNDLWQKAFIQMDASVEKKFKSNVSLFVKAGNLLNTPTELFIKGTNPANQNFAVETDGKTLIRKDKYGQSYLIGARYKF